MELSTPIIFFICLLFFFVAILYSSVGHGGASGYLAVMSFFAIAPKEMSTTALILNVFVAGTALWAYHRGGFFSTQLTLPFLLTSIPAAFLGGTMHIATQTYELLLAVALLVAAVRLMIKFENPKETPNHLRLPNLTLGLMAGFAIGLISGIVGIGGGIFLSPLILLAGWGDVKQTAATSAAFIVCNSVAGLLGRVAQSSFVWASALPFLLAATAGGFVGSRLGAKKFSTLTLRRLLGIVLALASVKLIVASI
jgi:uncharacterized membrane protein YfcA